MLNGDLAAARNLARDVALRGPRRRYLAQVLAAMPRVGDDKDFEREQTDRRG